MVNDLPSLAAPTTDTPTVVKYNTFPNNKVRYNMAVIVVWRVVNLESGL